MDSLDKAKNSPLTPLSAVNRFINKALLTPCRSVGLKRKFSSQKKVDSIEVSSTPSDSLKNTPVAVTNKRLLCKNISEKLKRRKLKLGTQEVGHEDDQQNLFNGDLEKIGEKTSDLCRSEVDCSLNKLSSPENHEDGIFNENGQTTSKEYNMPVEVTNEMILELVNNIRKKELKFQSLKETDVYAKQHNPEELKELVCKWKLGCQEALREIHSLLHRKGFSMSMAKVLDQFQVPYNMVNFNEDCDEFED